ncbi:uncharacterized protein LOC144349478 [Saccoglossus kowalevskii]
MDDVWVCNKLYQQRKRRFLTPGDESKGSCCYSLGEFEGIHLDSTECRPVAVTWFFLQGGESELIAAYNAFRKGIRLLATYGDGGKTAEILAFIATQKSVTENQIKGMVKSTFCDDNTDVDMCVQLLKDILTLNDSKDENHKARRHIHTFMKIKKIALLTNVFRMR